MKKMLQISHVFFAIACILVIGCGRTYDVPSDFSTYVDYFKMAAQSEKVSIKADSLIVSFQPLAGLEAGACSYQISVQFNGVFQLKVIPTIQIDNRSWSTMNETQREILMYHELGHCLLGRYHISMMNSDNEPASIMFPTNIVDFSYYEQHKEQYQKELFSEFVSN